MIHSQRYLLFPTDHCTKSVIWTGALSPLQNQLAEAAQLLEAISSAVENLRAQVTFLRISYTNNRESGAKA